MITIGTKLRFRPSGETDNNFYPERRNHRVTGTVTHVSRHLCVVEWQEGGTTLRECFGIRKGVLQDRSVEVVRR